MEFSRQEYESGLQLPSQGDLHDPGIEPSSLESPTLAGRFFTTSTTWEALVFSSYWVTRLLRKPQRPFLTFVWFLLAPGSLFGATLSYPTNGGM